MKNCSSILIVSSEFPPGPGGIGNQAYNLANYLYKDGFKVEVLTISDFATQQEIDDFDKNVPFKVVRFKRYKNRILNIYKRFALVNRILKLNKTDLVICSGRFSLLIGLYIKKRFSCLTMAIAHGGDINSTNKWIKRLTDIAIHSFNKVIAVSHYTLNKLPLLKGAQIRVVIPNGIDISEFEKSKGNSKNAVIGNPSLLTVGSLWHRKGQQNVIEHLPELKRKYPDIHYHCVGYPKEIEKFRKMVFEKGLENNVTFHGVVSRELLCYYYSNSDIFIMLSEEQESGDFEGFGIAILEANFFGLPAIGSVNSGIEDAIENNLSGRLVNHRSTDEIINAMENILSKKSDYSERAKFFALEHSWQSIIKRYIKEINLLCADL